MNNIKPYFVDNYVAVVFSASNFYIPYLAVTLNSLVVHAKDDINYDVVIFTKDATKSNRQIVIKQFTKENIAIRFVNVEAYVKEYDLSLWYEISHITVETYFRFFISKIMSSYKKVLYLDADLIIKEDISELYFTDMQGYPLAATTEVFISAFAQQHNKYDYFYKVLGFDVVGLANYFQAGVILFDVEKINANNYLDTALNMTLERNYVALDQDILNKLFFGNYYKFDLAWNYTPLQHHKKRQNLFDLILPEVKEQYLAVANPKIIHYADYGKPWLDPSQDMAEQWWFYARETPFYELLLYKMQHDVIYNIMHQELFRKFYHKYKLKYFIYKLLRNKNKASKYRAIYSEFKKKYHNLKYQ